jgi:hypothetical protein
MDEKLPAPCEKCRASRLRHGSVCDECQGKGYRLFINRSQTPESLKRPPHHGEDRGDLSVNGDWRLFAQHALPVIFAQLAGNACWRQFHELDARFRTSRSLLKTPRIPSSRDPCHILRAGWPIRLLP